MDVLLYLIFITLSLGHTYMVVSSCDYLEYKKPMEEVRRDRIERLSIRKIQKENKIYKLKSRQYKDEKKRSRAESKAFELEVEVVEINHELQYLNAYGEKAEKEDWILDSVLFTNIKK